MISLCQATCSWLFTFHDYDERGGEAAHTSSSSPEGYLCFAVDNALRSFLFRELFSWANFQDEHHGEMCDASPLPPTALIHRGKCKAYFCLHTRHIVGRTSLLCCSRINCNSPSSRLLLVTIFIIILILVHHPQVKAEFVLVIKSRIHSDEVPTAWATSEKPRILSSANGKLRSEDWRQHANLHRNKTGKLDTQQERKTVIRRRWSFCVGSVIINVIVLC